MINIHTEIRTAALATKCLYKLGVGAITVLTWLPVLCYVIWILLYHDTVKYSCISLDGQNYFIFAVVTASEREREMPRLSGHKSEHGFCSKHTIGF